MPQLNIEIFEKKSKLSSCSPTFLCFLITLASSKSHSKTSHVPWRLPRSFPKIFEKTRKFMKIYTFSGSYKNTSCSSPFSQGIESAKRMHFWMSYDLTEVGKLLRSQTNTQVLRLGSRGKPSTVVTARDDS